MEMEDIEQDGHEVSSKQKDLQPEPPRKMDKQSQINEQEVQQNKTKRKIDEVGGEVFSNCREIENPRTIHVFLQYVRSKNPEIIFLTETRRTVNEMEKIRILLGMDSCLAVDAVGRGGGLALLWNDSVTMEVQSYSRHHIDTIFTWWRQKENEEMTRCRLDRSLCTAEGETCTQEQQYSMKRKRFLIIYANGVRWNRQFHFEDEQCIKMSENTLHDFGSAQGSLEQKLRRVQVVLARTKVDLVANIRQGIKNKQKKLNVAHESIEMRHKILQLQSNTEDLLREEEIIWKQWSRASWLKGGDKNIKFFHQRTRERRKKNIVWALRKRDGSWTDS
ncbi:hypothetical protein Cni_G06764 [Canna indica]|uniref:Uncharacterized protein n=1 Tax=Canna indica TaxID=4628 RepID=A0AAQ3JZ78_9LILI|nr:hypothetical protein Cni_G06764 [Canna indica]